MSLAPSRSGPPADPGPAADETSGGRGARHAAAPRAAAPHPDDASAAAGDTRRRELRRARAHGPLSGKRRVWRRLAAAFLAALNRGVDALPGARRLRRRVYGLPTVRRVDVPVRRGGAALDGLRVALISDVHAGSFMNGEDLDRVFALVAEQQPDLVCLVGDLINTRDEELALLHRPLRRLAPRLGVFAVPGNHDHFWGRGLDWWREHLAAAGVEPLVNRGRRVSLNDAGATLWVAGVDDLTEGKPHLPAALDGARPDEPVLLLSHHPDYFVEAAAAGVDLTLSGHTHGGQVLLFGWTPLRHTDFGYWAGLFEEEGCRLYVGRGVGFSVLPLRIGAPAEIPLLTLRAR